MDKKIENAIVRTFKKIREDPSLLDMYNKNGRRMKPNADAAGLFINFYYQETGSHGNLDSRDFLFKREDGILTIVMEQKNYYGELSKIIYEELKGISLSAFYALWLRSNFEDPKNDLYGDSIVSSVPSVNIPSILAEDHAFILK
jgi:hypothetical protein